MEKKPYDHAFQYKDVQTLPETFADGVHQITVDGTTCRITLTVSRGDPPKPGTKTPTGQKVTAARLVMPVMTFAELYNQLDLLMRGLEQQGLVTRGSGGVKPTAH